MARLKDVAAHARVSVATVARVLREDPLLAIRPETRERVLTAAALLDYRPNRLASGLRTRRAGTIALFLPDPRNLGWTEMVLGIERTAVAFDYLVAMADVRGPTVNPEIFGRFVLERRVDGVLIAVGVLDDDLVTRLADRGMPIVSLDNRSDAVSGSVTMADGHGSRIAVDHLHSLGHRRIAHVTGRPEADVARRREAGYRAAMAGHGVTVDPEWVVYGDFTERGAKHAAEPLLALPVERRPTAVLATNLTAALGARMALKNAGIQVPSGMSLVAFDDHPIEDHLDPPLTAIRMPMAEMGAAGARMLFDAINGLTIRHEVVPDEPRLVVRASTGPPARR